MEGTLYPNVSLLKIGMDIMATLEEEWEGNYDYL
jgi:hypothetical protein